MSEQNRYVRTNLRLMPVQQSSKVVTQAGIPSKRLNSSHIYSETKKTVGKSDVLLINNTNIIKESSIPRRDISRETRPINGTQKTSDNEGEHIPKTSGKAYTYIGNRNAKAYLENNKPYPQRDQKTKFEKQMRENVPLKIKLSKTQENNQSLVSKLNCLGKTQSSNPTLDNKENGKPIRPKSARPESRWERRFDDDVESDEEYLEIRGKTPRPKSAKSNYSMGRSLNHNSQLESESDNSYSSDLTDMPPRPKTGHGRRRSSITNSEDDIWSSAEINIEERPKSRLGNRKIYNKNDNVQEEKHVTNNFLSLDSDLSQKSEYIGKSSTTSIKNKYIISTQPQNDTSSCQVREINYGVDDIDLNVDPVLYFLQEDNVPLTRSIKKPSLSKDTIGFIGKTKSSLQGNANIGCYGDYQNKHITKNSGLNRRNRLLSPQNTVQGRNLSLQSVNDRLAKGKVGVNNHTAKPCGNYIKAPKGPDSKSTSLLSKGSVSDFRTYGVHGKRSNNMYSNGAFQDTNINSEKVNRKPRKLQPISYSFR